MATKTKKPVPSSNGHVEEEIPLRLTKEEVQTTTKYTTREEALSLVGMYYSMQRLRKGAGNKLDAHRRKVDSIQDPLVVMRLKEELKKLEAQAQRALRAFAESSPLGRWCLSLTGVGPVSTAALLAHIDLKRCCCTQFAHLHTPDKRKDIPPHDCPGLATAGRIWSFAGLIDPREIVWEKGHKRPFNAQLKTVCWNLSTVWNKFSLDRDISNPGDLYIRLLRQRKIQEVERNERGLFRDQALAHLRDATKKKYNVSIELKECWASGKLPAFALQLRAQRYAVKIFLSHYHTVGRKILGLPEVKPWAQAVGGHADYIPPPHLDMITADAPQSKESEPTKNGRAKKT